MDSSNLSYKFASYSYNGVPLLTYGLIGLSVVFVGTAYGLNIMDTNNQQPGISGGESKNNRNGKTSKSSKKNRNRKGTLKNKK
jgi:hypothetical protein